MEGVAIGALVVALVLLLMMAAVRGFHAWDWVRSEVKPWLDRDDWPRNIETLPKEEATICGHGARDGYVVLPKLIPESLLDHAWRAYEQAVKHGAIALPREPVGEEDRLPGRYLNPHKRVRSLCRVA